MGNAEQEKQAEAVAKSRLLAFDLGIESAINAMGLNKEAVAKTAGAKDFREFSEWTLNYASALAEQTKQAEAAEKK